jgi:hypothetical protein
MGGKPGRFYFRMVMDFENLLDKVYLNGRRCRGPKPE